MFFIKPYNNILINLDMIPKMLVFSDKNVYNFCSQEQFYQKDIFCGWWTARHRWKCSLVYCRIMRCCLHCVIALTVYQWLSSIKSLMRSVFVVDGLLAMFLSFNSKIPSFEICVNGLNSYIMVSIYMPKISVTVFFKLKQCNIHMPKMSPCVYHFPEHTKKKVISKQNTLYGRERRCKRKNKTKKEPSEDPIFCSVA